MGGILVIDSDIAQRFLFNLRKGFNDTIDEWLTADQPDIGIVRCLPYEMLSTAKPNFHPDFFRRMRKLLRNLFDREGRIEADPGQQISQQFLL